MTTPANTSREVEVPETFHRLKRTAILLSAALIILVFSTPDDTRIFKLTFVDLAVPALPALVMLWLSAAYYFAGFRLEYRMVRQFNSEALDDKSGPYHAKIEQVADRITAIVRKAEIDASSVTSHFQQGLSQISHGLKYIMKFEDLFDPARRAALSTAAKNDPEVMKKRSRAAEMLEKAETELELLQIISLIDNQVRVSQEYISNAQSRLDELVENTEGMSKSIRREHERLKALSPRIYRERRILLTWWEYRATAALFIVATIAVSWPLGRRALAAMVTWT